MPSFRKPRVSTEARDDIRGILQYTTERWGSGQRREYQDPLYSTFQLLGRHPNLGRVRKEFGAGIRSYPAGHHVILYRVSPQTLLILRVLHERKDLAHEFLPDESHEGI